MNEKPNGNANAWPNANPAMPRHVARFASELEANPELLRAAHDTAPYMPQDAWEEDRQQRPCPTGPSRHVPVQIPTLESEGWGTRPGEGGTASHLARHAAAYDSSPQLIHSWHDIPDAMSIAVPQAEWTVAGIIPQGSITLIAGEPGSYKSWLALSLLRSVIHGAAFLERPCRASDVLYLDRENPLGVVRERLAMLGIDSLGSAKIWGGWLRDAPPAIGDPRLLLIARERRPLLIFDSLIRFHDSDENSATEMATVMQDLRALANLGATVIALHHRAKSETSRYRGSSDIAGGVDTAFSVARDRQAGVLTLQCFKSRYVEEFTLTLRPDLAGTGEFVVTDGPTVAPQKSAVERLAEAIRENPGQSQDALIASCHIGYRIGAETLRVFDGKQWKSKRGERNSRRFFPLDEEAIPKSELNYPD